MNKNDNIFKKKYLHTTRINGIGRGGLENKTHNRKNNKHNKNSLNNNKLQFNDTTLFSYLDDEDDNNHIHNKNTDDMNNNENDRIKKIKHVLVGDDTDNEFENWDELNISMELLRGIYAYGYEKPSVIQSKAIIPIISGKDIIAQAQSGTGKTATFSIGALSCIDTTKHTNQVIIISPTHELSFQTFNVISSLSINMKDIVIKTAVGGISIDEDAYIMKKNKPHIIIGCPGRIYDMIKRNIITTNTIKLLIIDEADEILSESFDSQISNIFRNISNNTQIALFSATLPPNIENITNKIMNSPVKICVKAESLTLEGIKQYFVALDDDEHKYETLKDLYKNISVSQCIIYVNSVKRVIDLYEAMKEDGFPVCHIHSKMDKCLREKYFTEFRNGNSRVLISSNVTARGIDIQQVSCVINFDLPRDVHIYLHRIGRSGRWGRKGLGINFMTKRDIFKMKEIEEYYDTQIDELPCDFNFF